MNCLAMILGIIIGAPIGTFIGILICKLFEGDKKNG